MVFRAMAEPWFGGTVAVPRSSLPSIDGTTTSGFGSVRGILSIQFQMIMAEMMKKPKCEWPVLFGLLLSFMVAYALCGGIFLFIVRPAVWWALTDLPYEKPSVDLIWRTFKASRYTELQPPSRQGLMPEVT